MALSKPTLKGLIHDNLVAEFGTALDDTLLQKFSKAVADAIIDHITASAVVQPGTFTNAGGAVTGTGTIT